MKIQNLYKVDGHRGYYGKWNKPDIEIEILCFFSYRRQLKKKKSRKIEYRVFIVNARKGETMWTEIVWYGLSKFDYI